MSERATDFLPCPHCGGADIRVDCHRGEGRGIFHKGDDVWSMCCYDCGAMTPNRYSREVLRAAWNRRTSPASE
jgi:Lar family restriction alleviation protein